MPGIDDGFGIDGPVEIEADLRADLAAAEAEIDSLRNTIDAMNEGNGVPDDDLWAEMKHERDVLIEAIRNLREATRGKYTLRSLAELLGVTPTQLSRWTAKPTTGPPDFICTRGNLDD